MKRHRRWIAPIAATVTLLASAFVAAGPAAATGTISITDSYVPQARYSPGASVPVTAVLQETSGTSSWSGSVSFTMTHLGVTV
ncbi:MAG: hypothetical protein J0H43_00245, partial [Actinobacteria bacterium]|nr:hypothetical protein [Actinomycetota bacterium]